MKARLSTARATTHAISSYRQQCNSNERTGMLTVNPDAVNTVYNTVWEIELR